MMKLFFFLSHKSDELDDAEKSSLFQLLSPPGGPQRWKIRHVLVARTSWVRGLRLGHMTMRHRRGGWASSFAYAGATLAKSVGSIIVGHRDGGLHRRRPWAGMALTKSTGFVALVADGSSHRQECRLRCLCPRA